jgi:hypothetical protein
MWQWQPNAVTDFVKKGLQDDSFVIPRTPPALLRQAMSFTDVPTISCMED